MTASEGPRPARRAGTSPFPPVVVMGVSGSGKSTVGRALAERLALPYVDGDDLHPPTNVAAMRAGTPLTDAQREPWLDAVGEWLANHPGGGVVSCSALRRRYRDRLRAWAPGLLLVQLDLDEAGARARVGARRDHFMPVDLVASQLATLEPPTPDEAHVRLVATRPLPELVPELVEVVLGRRDEQA